MPTSWGGQGGADGGPDRSGGDSGSFEEVLRRELGHKKSRASRDPGGSASQWGAHWHGGRFRETLGCVGLPPTQQTGNFLALGTLAASGGPSRHSTQQCFPASWLISQATLP